MDPSHANSLRRPATAKKLLAAFRPDRWGRGSGNCPLNGFAQIERDNNAGEDIKPDVASALESNDSRPSNSASNCQVTLAQAKRLALRLAGSRECSH
jgi:hypothetical protein